MKFSIVVPTRRGIDALKPLFNVSDKDTEIIIIDTTYNEKTKKALSELNHDFYKITYAPPMEIKKNMVGHMTETAYKRDLVRCHNTGFSYVENDWIIKLDDCTELKPDFFTEARKSINSALTTIGKKFALRAVKLESWSNHKKWQQYPYLRKLNIPEDSDFIKLDRGGLGNGMFVTLDQAVFHRNLIDELNGTDERYDIGHGFDDVDLMQRFITLGCKVLLDQRLVTYQTEHWTKADPFDFSRLLYEFTKVEILNGRYYAYNPYVIENLRAEMKERKKNYEVHKKYELDFGTTSLLGKVIAEVDKSGTVKPIDDKIKEISFVQPDQPEIIVNIPKEKIIYRENPKYFTGTYPFDRFFNPESLETNRKRIMDLKDRHKGEDLFILGNSSDLKKELIDKLRGKITFAANAFIVCRDAWNFEPTYFVVTNQGIFDNHLRNIRPEFNSFDGKPIEGGSVATLLQQAKTAKFVLSDLILKPAIASVDYSSCSRLHERINFLRDNVHIKVLNKEELEPPYMIQSPPSAEDISFDLIKGTYMFGTVITDLMLPLAAWMGFKNIYLTALSGGEAHFYDTSPRNFWTEEHQKEIYALYGLFKKRLNEIGINIYNLDRPLTEEEVRVAEENSLKKENPTKYDGHFWNGPIYPTRRIIGKEPYLIEYKPLEEVL